MSRYRRLKIEGGALFFTVALADRGSDLLVQQIERLRRAYAAVEQRHRNAVKRRYAPLPIVG
jgi:putative transposase